ncbi:aldo/keto reductase [Thermopirellula anaerolimosa]
MASQSYSRREFVRQSGILSGTAWVSGGWLANVSASEAVEASSEARPIPKRVLGRTGEQLTIFTLGTAPCGNSREMSFEDIAKVVNTAIDLGINSIDTAPAYIKAEEGVGLAMKTRRKEVFLATKVPADTVEEGEKSLARSLKLLQTDYVDLLYYHSVGNRKVDGALDAEGVFTWLVRQKAAGKCRYIGISGHNLPGRFAQFLETGEVDVLLAAVNYVDRHTYNFEEQVLPIARKHNVGIIAMKVLGGADPAKGSYANPRSTGLLVGDKVGPAIRYALSLPGVCSVNLGINNVEQLRQDIAHFYEDAPLSEQETAALLAEGKPLADKWGAHFGPVTEPARS